MTEQCSRKLEETHLTDEHYYKKNLPRVDENLVLRVNTR